MFRHLSGCKARYHDLTLVVVAEFNEWKALIAGPGVTIHGVRQFSEAKAKEQALLAARAYVHEQKHLELPVIEEAEWVPTDPDDWLVWHG